MSNQASWKVVSFFVDIEKKRWCQGCRQEEIRNIFWIKNEVTQMMKEVGKECAKNFTNQNNLIDKLHEQMVSLTGKRERFCTHRSAKCWSVPLVGAKWINGGGFKERWEIQYFGYRLRVNETVTKQVIIKVNGGVIMNNNNTKPLYFSSMDQGKLYFFDRCANSILINTFNKYKV